LRAQDDDDHHLDTGFGHLLLREDLDDYDRRLDAAGRSHDLTSSCEHRSRDAGLYCAICPREAWLMAHELEPEDFGRLLAEGRLNQGRTTNGQQKELLARDWTRSAVGRLIVRR